MMTTTASTAGQPEAHARPIPTDRLGRGETGGPLADLRAAIYGAICGPNEWFVDADQHAAQTDRVMEKLYKHGLLTEATAQAEPTPAGAVVPDPRVERAARALWERLGQIGEEEHLGDLESWDEVDEDGREAARDLARAVLDAAELIPADADYWIVTKVAHDQNAPVGPRIMPNGWIRNAAGTSAPWHAREYAAQLLAAADKVDAERPAGGDA